jgi:hypothetical protein
MIITWQLPEERYAAAMFRVPIFFGSGLVKSAIFVPNCPIYVEGQVCELAIHSYDNFLGAVKLEENVPAFAARSFDFWAQKFSGCLILSKKPVEGRIFALPLSLVQVEIEPNG